MRLGGFAFPCPLPAEDEKATPLADYRLTPHYREQTPLDALLLNTQAGLDDFPTEKYAGQVEAILARWSSGLRQSPQNVREIESLLAPGFRASSRRPTEERPLRSDPGLEIRRSAFPGALELNRQDFIAEFQSLLASWSEVLTAEFQVTGIEGVGSPPSNPQSPSLVRTRVRYDLVGSAQDFHREERSGRCDLEWKLDTTGPPVLTSWRTLDETRSRAASPAFADITALALAGLPSYAGQMLHGEDYWRTVLDGASGIDIYGHNGVAAGDIDNDGFDDLYVCQPAGLPNRLYRNRGDGTFEDVTEAAGVGVLENTSCALFVDVDNDGRQDLIVVRSNGPLLFLNQGNGRFELKPDAFRFATPPQGTFTGAAAADYDRDGRVDVYFCLYIYYQGVDQYQYPTPYYDAENGPPNFLMHNNGDGTFSDVTAKARLDQNNRRYSFCCGWCDDNQDGWPDLYVVNDFGRKNLYRNRGDGTFADVAAQAGVEDIGAGMSVCWFDYDNDSRQDLYVADMWSAAGERVTMQEAFMKSAPEEVRALYRKHARGNSLFRNTGGGSFQDASARAGVEMGRWSWSSDSWDFDHDGFPDLYIATGMISGPNRHDLASFFWRQVVAQSPSEAEASRRYEQGWNAINELIRSDGTWNGYERNVFYANNRDGTFSEVSGALGLDFPEDGRTFALADLDHDGRLEVILKNRNAPQLRILKNRMRGIGKAVVFRLRGQKSNRDAIGTAITLEAGNLRQTKFVQAGSGFLAQHTKEIFFGLGDYDGPVRATIRWPSGLVQKLENLAPGHRMTVEEGSAEIRAELFRESRVSDVSPPDRSSMVPEILPLRTETWLLAPVAAPEFSLPDLGGQTRSLSGYRGRPLLLNFWATHAAPCATELDLFERHHAEWSRQGLEVLTINVNDPGEGNEVRAFSRGRRLSFPVLLATRDVAAIYNLVYRYMFDRRRDLGIPTSFLLDAEGVIVKVYQGPVDRAHVEEDFRRIPRTAQERLAVGLPFSGVTEITGFHRNNLLYGSLFFQRGYIDQAEAYLRLALRDDPESADAYYGLGSVYLQKQKAAEARDCFERALKLRAGFPDTRPNALNNLGILAAREGRFVEAIPYFQQAIEQNPDYLIALENLGNVYRQQGRMAEARQMLERALAVDPDDPEANYSLGMVFAQLDDAPHAEEYLRHALRARPDYPEALNNLGVLYLRTGRRDEAVTNFETCIRTAPAFDQSYLNLARVYVIEGSPEKARAVLLQLLQQHPNHAAAEKMLAELPR